VVERVPTQCRKKAVLKPLWLLGGANTKLDKEEGRCQYLFYETELGFHKYSNP